MSTHRIIAARCALGMLAYVAAESVLSSAAVAGGGPPLNPEDIIHLSGIVRDFRPTHTDFDTVPSKGYGHYMWNIDPLLGPDEKPVYVGGGAKVASQCLDAKGRPICWTLYDPARDTAAVPGALDNGGITSGATFDEWFNDWPGVNQATAVTVTGVMQTGGQYNGMYLINVPQFYPIDDRFYGNDSTNNRHNVFFTFQIIADFVYDASMNYEFMFKSDDDTWVYIDGKMVADLGGIKGSPEQWVDLDRLALVDGQTYKIHLFTANRGGNPRLHLATNIPLNTARGSMSSIFLMCD